jgi:hypothetical protein
MWHWKFRQIELLYCVLQIHKSLSVKGVILGQTPRVASSGVKMAFRHTVGRVIPWSGCVPAEPASVSPGERTIPQSSSPRQDELLRRREK